MAHIVCITGGLTGIFNASLALVKQLEQAGHRLTYASPYDFQAAIAAEGIDYVQLNRWVIQPVDPPMSRWQKLRTLRARQQRAVDELGVQHFVKTIQALEPDLVLMDMEMTPHIMAGVMGGLPIVLLCQFLSLWKRPNLPPINTTIVPGEGWRGQWLGIEWSWLRNGWATWKEAQQQRWKWMGLDRRSIWGCYARQVGYPFPEQFGFTQWLIPYHQGQLPVLCFNTLALDFPHEPHPLMHYVGPMVCQDRQDSQVSPSTWESLEKLFESRRESRQSDSHQSESHSSESHQAMKRSLIYCGCSTFVKGNRQWLETLIAAVADCPQWDLVVGLGGQMDRDQLGMLPANVHAFRWAPQWQVLKNADCAVINGGINTINECIDLGVPMLLYSLGHADQDGDVTRVAYHGLGIIGRLRQDNAVKMRTAIQTLLSDSSYPTRLNQMRAHIHRDRQDNRAAKIVDSLLNAQNAKQSSRAVAPP